jgi:hypothetical protein
MTRSLHTALLTCALVGASASRADYIDHFANPADIGLLKVPRTGITRVLVLPVIVDDLSFDQGSEAAFLAEVAAFYDPAAHGWAFTPYWETTSLGRFRPEATVAAPVHFATCPPLGAYADCEIPRGAGFAEGDTAGAVEVMVDSLAFLDQAFRCASDGPGAATDCTAGGGVNFVDFDTSGIVAGTPDQVVDGVLLVSNARFPGIALPIKDLTTNPLLQFLGPFPEFAYDGVIVGAVAIAGFAQAPEHTTWVSVHEFGHLMGWADLYNEDGTTTDMPYTLMGGWFYRDPGSLPDAFSRMAAGFSHVVQVAGDGTFVIGAADVTGTVLKVGTGDEHFLVELRREVSGVLDGDLTVPFGVVIERVRLQKRPSPQRGRYFDTLQNCVNCLPFDTFLAIEQADGLFELERQLPRDDDEDLFLAGSAIAPTDDTEPRTLDHRVFSTNRYDGTPTDITIRVLEADAEHAVIEIESPPVSDPCAEITAMVPSASTSLARMASRSRTTCTAWFWLSHTKREPRSSKAMPKPPRYPDSGSSARVSGWKRQLECSSATGSGRVPPAAPPGPRPSTQRTVAASPPLTWIQLSGPCSSELRRCCELAGRNPE